MTRLLSLALTLALIAGPAVAAAAPKTEPPKPAVKMLQAGDTAPAFKIKDASGKEIDLAELTAQGPVLVRLTCGCSGCDKELAYFQALHESYKKNGLISLAVF